MAEKNSQRTDNRCQNKNRIIFDVYVMILKQFCESLICCFYFMLYDAFLFKLQLFA